MKNAEQLKLEIENIPRSGLTDLQLLNLVIKIYGNEFEKANECICRLTEGRPRCIFVAHFEKQGEASPAMLDVNGVRFFSLPPKDKADEEKINKAAMPFAVKPKL